MLFLLYHINTMSEVFLWLSPLGLSNYATEIQWKHSACNMIRAVEVCVGAITCISAIWLVSLNGFYKKVK